MEEFFLVNRRTKNLVTAPYSSMLMPDGDIKEGSSERGTDIIANMIGDELNFSVIRPLYSKLVLDLDKAQPAQKKDAYLDYYKLIDSILERDSLFISIRCQKLAEDFHIASNNTKYFEPFVRELKKTGYKLVERDSFSSHEFNFAASRCKNAMVLVIDKAKLIKDDSLDYSSLIKTGEDIIKALSETMNR